MTEEVTKTGFEVIDTGKRQLAIKRDFQKLFLGAFKKPISDREWEHFYVNGPIGQTVSFVRYEGDDMIAHGGLIPQRLVSKTAGYIDYYLQTAIMVSERHQTLVLFKELLDTMDGYVTDRNSFSVAYPNKNTYLPFVKMLGWHMVREYDIGQYVLEEGAVSERREPAEYGFDSEIFKDESFMRWRGEINGMKLLKTDEYEMIYKKYEESLEILDLSVPKDGFRVPLSDIIRNLGFEKVNIAGCFSAQVSFKDLAFVKAVGITQRMCFYPASHEICKYGRIRPSLLISDVF